MDRGPAPQGLQNSAQGFNPGNPQNKRFALKLKGREMRVPDQACTYCRAKSESQLGRAQLDHPPHFRLVRTFDLAPLQGASLLVDDSQG